MSVKKLGFGMMRLPLLDKDLRHSGSHNRSLFIQLVVQVSRRQPRNNAADALSVDSVLSIG